MPSAIKAMSNHWDRLNLIAARCLNVRSWLRYHEGMVWLGSWGMLHFERRHEPLAARYVFFFRVFRNFVVAGLLISMIAGFGTWGFSFFEGHTFIDSLHNAVRIICGLDPVKTAANEWGKWFEIAFHLLSSFVVVVATAIFLMPVLHRVLHRFHIE
jgi:hypothetical protein